MQVEPNRGRSEMREQDSRETWRVFCAIDLPETVRKSIAEHASELRRVVPESRASWSRPESIHLTLKFIGEIPVTKVERFTLAAKRAVEGFAPFLLGIGGTGVFPAHGSPRVLWIGVQDSSGKLAELHSRLEAESATVGFERETRSFHPHLTLARLQRSGRRAGRPLSGETQLARVLGSTHKEMRFPAAEIMVSELVVIRSELGSARSKYTVISTQRLGRSTN